MEFSLSSESPVEDVGGVGIPLDELAPHAYANVVSVDANDEDLHRLMAMGVCEKHAVQLVQAGDPLILKVLGSRIGLSARLAHRIRVQPHEDPSAAITHAPAVDDRE